MSAVEFISYCRICRSSNVEIAQALLSPFFGFRLLGWSPLEIGSSEFRDLSAGVSYFPARTISCPVCGGVSLGLLVDDASLANYYFDYQGHAFLESRYKLEPSFRQRMEQRNSPNTLRKRGESVDYLDRIDDFLFKNIEGPLPDYVLDIGGGTGSNSPLKSQSTVDVIDIAPELTIPPKDSYRLICLMNVLEHVMDPQATLSLAVSYMDMQRPSYVLVEVPVESFMEECLEDIDSETEIKCGQYLEGKKIWTEHVNCFTPKALILLAKSVGLELVVPIARFETGSASLEAGAGNKKTALVGFFSLSGKS
jgi:hypothetical protein